MSKYVQRLLSPRDDHVRKSFMEYPLCGLRNLRNNLFCYHHQCNIKGKPGDKRIYHGSVLLAFISIVNAIWSGRYRFVTPLALKDLIGDSYEQFRGSQQNDAQEFLLVLLQHLDKELLEKTFIQIPPSSSTPMICSPCAIQASNICTPYSLSSSPICDDNDNPEIEMETFVNQNFTESNEFDSFSRCCSNQNNFTSCFVGELKKVKTCLSCNTKTVQTEEFNCLSLAVPQWFSSLSHPISIKTCLRHYFHEEHINGEVYCDEMPESKKYTKQKVTLPLSDLSINKFCQKKTDERYLLYSFITHTGSNDKGHYITWNKVIDQWYCCDDEKISQDHPPTVSSSPYLLFFQKH
ncbi:ubiquitinyl hydrolase 1 [Entamoeba marina]